MKRGWERKAERRVKEESGGLRLRAAQGICALQGTPAGQKGTFLLAGKQPAYNRQYFSLRYIITWHFVSFVHSCCVENAGTFCNIFNSVVS